MDGAHHIVVTKWAHLVVVQKGLQFAAKWAHFILVHDDLSGDAFQFCGLAIWIWYCDMCLYLRVSGSQSLVLVKRSLTVRRSAQPIIHLMMQSSQRHVPLLQHEQHGSQRRLL